MVPTTPFYVEKSLGEFENYNTEKVLEINSNADSGINTYTVYVMLLTTVFLTVSIQFLRCVWVECSEHAITMVGFVFWF